jgi:hypothetical protein
MVFACAISGCTKSESMVEIYEGKNTQLPHNLCCMARKIFCFINPVLLIYRSGNPDISLCKCLLIPYKHFLCGGLLFLC